MTAVGRLRHQFDRVRNWNARRGPFSTVTRPGAPIVLVATIRGVPGIQAGMMPNSFNDRTTWLTDPRTCCIRFEDLIGPRGGGSEERQHRTVRRVMEFLGAEASEHRVRGISEALFSDRTRTFDKGQTGAWRQAFSTRHVELFREVSGDLLATMGYSWDT
ncbi:MAG: sulfotransferase domain-containing protein [Acidimicrobiia bacterium]|nr:sulfotransferase domain-containing protein [Acidimicrobiia bacterium]